jgi:hypothetical protein
MSIAPDLKALLPKQVASQEEDDRPAYHLWVFDPQTSEVTLDDNEHKSPADQVTHKDLAPHVHHPERINGYAYSIKDGWRITDDAHNEVRDKFIVKRVMAKLQGEYPEPALPHISYHRIPEA